MRFFQPNRPPLYYMSLGEDLSIFSSTLIGLTARLCSASPRCCVSGTLALRLRPEQNFAIEPKVLRHRASRDTAFPPRFVRMPAEPAAGSGGWGGAPCSF